jgi:outer membrane protein
MMGRMMRANFMVFLWVFPQLCLGENSINPGDTLKWDLKTCIHYAVKNNITINSLRLSEKTSREELALSKASVLPNLNGSFAESLTHGNSLNPYTNSYSSGTYWAGDYSLNSVLNLYQGGYIREDIRQKVLMLQSSHLSTQEQENAVIILIIQSYLSIALDKEDIIAQKEVLSSSTAQVELANKRLKVGSIAKKDLVQLQSAEANDKYQLVNYQNTAQLDILGLKQLLQLSTDTLFDIIPPDTLLNNHSRLQTLKQAQNLSLSYRPEIKNSLLSYKISEFDLLKAKTGFLPSISLSGALGSTLNSEENGFLDQLNHNFYEQLTLALSLPISNRRINRTKVSEARIALDQSHLNILNTKTILLQSVEKAYLQTITAQNQWDAALEALKYNQESYRIANQELKIGVVNLVDFLVQKTLYVQALQASLQAKYNVALSLRIYDFYTGNYDY